MCRHVAANWLPSFLFRLFLLTHIYIYNASNVNFSICALKPFWSVLILLKLIKCSVYNAYNVIANRFSSFFRSIRGFWENFQTLFAFLQLHIQLSGSFSHIRCITVMTVSFIDTILLSIMIYFKIINVFYFTYIFSYFNLLAE